MSKQPQYQTKQQRGSAQPVIRDQLSLTSWLLVGACVQSFLFICLPRLIALLPAVGFLLLRLVDNILMSTGYTRNRYLDGTYKGKWTAQIPNQDGSFTEKPADKELVLFIVGASSNHPMGLLAPGFKEIGDFINHMWDDLEDNREKWGYLGKSTTFVGTDRDAGNNLVTLSYWKDMASLQAFASSPSHMAGLNWWNKNVKKHDHLGIMHEVYATPKGSWENIYANFRTVGMGQTRYAVTEPEKKSNVGNGLLSGLVSAKGSQWKSMKSRMGRAELDQW